MDEAQAPLSYLKPFAVKHAERGWSEKTLRWLIFSHGQQLEQAGAIVRFGARVLIDENKFFAFLRAGSPRRTPARTGKLVDTPAA
jgi:hypothetical protein